METGEDFSPISSLLYPQYVGIDKFRHFHLTICGFRWEVVLLGQIVPGEWGVPFAFHNILPS